MFDVLHLPPHDFVLDTLSDAALAEEFLVLETLFVLLLPLDMLLLLTFFVEFEVFDTLLVFVVLFLPNLAIIATLFLATPVADEFRYAYNLAYCLPLYVGVFIHFMKKTN